MGGVFVKSGPFLNAGCIMYTVSVFLVYILLIWECVRTQRTPPTYGPAKISKETHFWLL